MSSNRIAVYGHRGWASSAIVTALAQAAAHITVLHRQGSDISMLPPNVTTIEVDLSDQNRLVTAFEGIDIVISLVGLHDTPLQHHIVAALPKTNVKLFVPSNLALRVDEEGLRVPALAAKRNIEEAARAAGIPLCIVLPGNFVESNLMAPLVGISFAANFITFSGNSEHEPLSLCTRDYVSAGYVSIFATTPAEELEDRVIGLSEMKPTGANIASAFEDYHGKPPTTRHMSLSTVQTRFEAALQQPGGMFALPWFLRKIWGNGSQIKWMEEVEECEVEGYERLDIWELVAGGKLQAYKLPPPEMAEIMTNELM